MRVMLSTRRPARKFWRSSRSTLRRKGDGCRGASPDIARARERRAVDESDMALGALGMRSIINGSLQRVSALASLMRSAPIVDTGTNRLSVLGASTKPRRRLDRMKYSPHRLTASPPHCRVPLSAAWLIEGVRQRGRGRLAAVRTVLVQLPPNGREFVAQRRILLPQNLNLAPQRVNQLTNLRRENHPYLDSYFRPARPLQSRRRAHFPENCCSRDSPGLGATKSLSRPERPCRRERE